MSDDKVVPLRVIESVGEPHGAAVVAEMLERAKQRAVEDGISKAVVLLLDDRDMSYDTTVIQTGMSIPEVLALLNVCVFDTQLVMRGEA